MKKFILYVEGSDDLAFIAGLVKVRFSTMDLMKESEMAYSFPDESRIIAIGGYEKIEKRIDEIRIFINDGFSILVIADSDKSKQQKEAYYESIKEKYRIDFELFLAGDESGKGAIERLKEKIIKEEFRSLSDCFKKFNECLKNENKNYKGYIVPHPFNSVKTYFDKFTKLANKEEADIFNFEHESLNELHIFLKNYIL